MIGQHSTYLEVGRCCSAETRQPDSPRPSTSASSCNRFDFARPLVSTDVYAVPLNGRANEASSPRGNLGDEDPGTKSYEREEGRVRGCWKLAWGSTVVDEVEKVFFFSQDRQRRRFPPACATDTRLETLLRVRLEENCGGGRRGVSLVFEVTIIPPVSLAIFPRFFLPSSLTAFLVSFVVGNPSIRSSSRPPR